MELAFIVLAYCHDRQSYRKLLQLADDTYSGSRSNVLGYAAACPYSLLQ
jgi:hypothetical protein